MTASATAVEHRAFIKVTTSPTSGADVYQAACRCGWRSDPSSVRSVVVRDGLAHCAAERPKPPRILTPVAPTTPATARLDRALRGLHDHSRRTPCETESADLWFSRDVADQAHAAMLCRACPVGAVCAAAGKSLAAEGVWGALALSG